jgi:hypothetical protein
MQRITAHRTAAIRYGSRARDNQEIFFITPLASGLLARLGIRQSSLFFKYNFFDLR